MPFSIDRSHDPAGQLQALEWTVMEMLRAMDCGNEYEFGDTEDRLRRLEKIVCALAAKVVLGVE